jgi:Domain of unknown function (DUF4340)
MKKSTLIILVAAVALGAAVYYYDWKRTPKDNAAEESKPAFHFTVPDVNGLDITHAGQKFVLEKQNDAWQMTQPIATGADGPTVEGIVTEVAGANVSRTITPSGDLSPYGLKQPALTASVRLKDGTRHSLQFGDKDFSGSSVYAIVDDAKQVSLIPAGIFETANKPLDDLRDRAVLHFNTDNVQAVEVKKPSGEVALVKQGSNWVLQKPRETAASLNAVTSMLEGISLGKFTTVASETPTPQDLARDGLANPAVTVTLTLKDGKQATLQVGKKDGQEYDARDPSRPMVFHVGDTLYKKLDQGLAELRDKKIYAFDANALASIEINNHSTNETMVCSKGADKTWKIDQPVNVKGKTADIYKISAPLDSAEASEVIDSPSADIRARLAKPALEITFTETSGKKTTLRFSEETEGYVYAESTASTAVYKITKQTLDDLSFKADALGS